LLCFASGRPPCRRHVIVSHDSAKSCETASYRRFGFAFAFDFRFDFGASFGFGVRFGVDFRFDSGDLGGFAVAATLFGRYSLIFISMDFVVSNAF